MLSHLTVVTPKEKEDDDHNISLTKVYSKNNYNMPLKNCNRALLICLVSLCCTSIAIAKSIDFLKPPPHIHECGSMDLRNNCEQLDRLYNCTAITGFLDITFIVSDRYPCNITAYHFENLREITDFLLINSVRNLTNIKEWFPNLTVIRGQRVFINYALLLTDLQHLQKVEFKSLISIPRGHVLIDGSPDLCYMKNINWERLTLSPGTNMILYNKSAVCVENVTCSGCKREYCWSNDVCQKFESDSVISPMQDTAECHKQCLGGCYNKTAQGCAVCKTYTDHGTCVEQCPDDKYASSHFLRCYTREECLDKHQYILNNTCVGSCPSGYNVTDDTRECKMCDKNDGCPKVCNTDHKFFYISNIMDADNIMGCEILNSSLLVNIRQFINQDLLIAPLKDIKEIKGFLKVNRSPYITSLNFLQNLETIHGQELESNEYALIINSNHNLSKLWDVKENFKIVKGGMYIHANNKLCNRFIREFRQHTEHDNSLDSIQKSDRNILCAPAKVNLKGKAASEHSLTLTWPQIETLEEVEVLYKPLSSDQEYAESSEMDTDVCNREKWHREMLFKDKLAQDDYNYIHILQNLKSNTNYAVFLKTFDSEDDTLEARSEIVYVKTRIDIRTAPKINIVTIRDDSIDIEFFGDPALPFSEHLKESFVLEVYHIPDDKKDLDTRNYCDEPLLYFKDVNEDYDHCCVRQQKEEDDRNFLSQITNEFACFLSQRDYCKIDTGPTPAVAVYKSISPWKTDHSIRSLKPFNLYVLEIKICSKVGCSSYTMQSFRTNYSTTADRVKNFFACHVEDTDEYRIHFSEPSTPNGYVTSYDIHFLNNLGGKNSLNPDSELVCITRLEHERNQNVYVGHFKTSFNMAAVRINSLGYKTFMEWINIVPCEAKKPTESSKAWIYYLIAFVVIATFLILCFVFKFRIIILYNRWRRRGTVLDDYNLITFRSSPEEEVRL